MRPVVSFLMVTVFAGVGVVGAAYRSQSDPPPSGAFRVVLDSGVVAAPGRVEPRSEEVVLSAEISGRIAKIHVDDGDTVAAGQIVAELDNRSQVAKVAEAEAYVRQKDAELRRVKNGAHLEERREAAAAVREAEAVFTNSGAELARREVLVKNGFASDEQLQRLQAAHLTAKARLEAARSRLALLTTPTREEDVARAQADFALAEARLQEAQAELQKTVIRSPLSGTVLRRYRREGEVVSELRDTRILSVGDLGVLRVRADIDEVDIGRVALGSRAYVKADAFGDEKFWGRVIRLGQMLGRKNFLTEVPGERVDTKVLEAVVELDKPGRLLPGLRVDVYFEPPLPPQQPGS